MESHFLGLVSEALEFLYVLLPVISLTVLAYRLTSETGKRTGSSLLFFSTVFYLIGTYESFYITANFGVITSAELIIIQFIYLLAGFLLISGIFSLHNFFTRITEIGNLKSTLKKAFPILFIYLLSLVPYFLMQSYEKIIYLFTDLFYALIQAQFFIAYFVLGDVMFTNKTVCEKAPKRSKQIKFVSLYYLIEPIVWLWSLNAGITTPVLDKIRLLAEVTGTIIAGFLTFNILHILISHSPLILDKFGSKYLAIAKAGLIRRLAIMAVFVGIAVILTGTFSAGIFFQIQERIFFDKVKKDAEIIKVFAKESEREIESLSMRVKLLMKDDFRSEKIRDTLKSLIERYGELISNVFFFDEKGKVFYSHPKAVGIQIPYKNFSPDNSSTSLFIKDESGHYHLYVFYPRYEANKIFSGGIGIEINFDNIRENLKKTLESPANIYFIDLSNIIISADSEKELGKNFLEHLRSIVDQPESIQAILEGMRGDKGSKSFSARVYRNSRRTILAVSATPVNLNGNGFLICDYHFLEDFSLLEVLPRSAFVWLMMSFLGIVISVVMVLYLNFKFSEHLEYEIEKRTIELLKSEMKYRSIVENPFFGAYLMDASGFKFVNDKFCEIFGYTKDEILNLKDYSVLIHPDDRERLNQQLIRRLRGEFEINKWSAKGLRKDGQVIFIEGYTKRVEYEGKPAAQGMIIDVTEEVKRREALQQSQKLEALGTLASGIAHDFNNILQIIIGAGQLLGMKVKNPEYEKWINTITSTALRGAELAKRLLTFARKKPTGEVKPINLHHLIEESVRVFKETFPRNIEISCEFDANDFTILGEEAQVQQIIFNLAVNAKDAMPDGGKLIFKTENRFGNEFDAKPGVEYIVMHVIDTGIGMTEGVKRRLFEPFFTTKPIGKGTGLGLSTVYGIVKSYDGFIKVYSELGKGTKFSIYLPVYKEETKTETDLKVEVKKTGTLLLIDDEEEIRFAGKELLEAEGFKVYTAGDGFEGVNLYKEHKDEIDLIILDLNMPKMSGRETLSQLLLINPSVKVIIATGYIMESEKEEIQGVAGYIEKPFDINKLLKMIQELI